MAEHDSGYKLLFSHPRMVEELLRGFVHEPWVTDLDFDTLERTNASYTSDDLRELANYFISLNTPSGAALEPGIRRALAPTAPTPAPSEPFDLPVFKSHCRTVPSWLAESSESDATNTTDVTAAVWPFTHAAVVGLPGSRSHSHTILSAEAAAMPPCPA